MCLVSYIPTSEGFILSSNRDEAPHRSINQLEVKNISDQSVCFPSDTKGGSWIFASEQNKFAVILNGGFVKHNHRPPYKISRGLMLKSYFEFDGHSDFLNNYDFNGIEPFTSILKDRQLISFVWDGIKKHIEILDDKSTHVFSSCTLYSPAVQQEREKVFFKLLKDKNLDLKTAKMIHREGKLGNKAHDFLMQIEERVKTVSITHIEKSKTYVNIEFHDLVSDRVQKESLKLKNSTKFKV